MLRPTSVSNMPMLFHRPMPLRASISAVASFVLVRSPKARVRYFASSTADARTYAVGCSSATRRLAATAARL